MGAALTAAGPAQADAPPAASAAHCGITGEHRVCAYATSSGITVIDAGDDVNSFYEPIATVTPHGSSTPSTTITVTTDSRGYGTASANLAPGTYDVVLDTLAVGPTTAGGRIGSVTLTVPGDGSAATSYPVPVDLTPSDEGVVEAGVDGGVVAFGNATFYGSIGGTHLAAPVTGIAASLGGGYWLVASDGGVFTFGDATFYGSTGDLHLAALIVGLAATTDQGYTMLGSDGGIFNFGDAPFYGSATDNSLASRVNVPFAGISSLSSGGYALAFGNGIGYAVYDSSSAQDNDAQAHGAMYGPPATPIVGISS